MKLHSLRGFTYQIRDHGCEHAQYFQGAGVAFSIYTDIVVGCGDSAQAAGEDALEQFWEAIDKRHISVHDAERLESAVHDLSDAQDAHAACYDAWQAQATPKSTVRDFETWHEECELSHFVSIRWVLGKDRQNIPPEEAR